MSTLAQIGASLRQARLAQGLSATQLSERTGLSRVTLRELENGLGNARLSTVLAVCDALDLSLTVAPRAVADLQSGDARQRPTELSALLARTREAGLALRGRRKDAP
ncbi:helix-turn-helix transcriptional regulator [Orrella sp. JC864]|uniref:helix-turn-helix domain-containing protein n=1 Tax=Orrella sp. JC864 TaxID=3120298 RepID=UPI003009A4E1